ncbi:MAG: polysaccharide deacetylase family protein [Bacillota bacterium]|nr:polysaccharide deacetylase family protein [Bacillota bacterium]
MCKSHGIMFHHFHDNTIHIREQGSISAEELDQMVDFYERDHEFISAQAYVQKTISGSLNRNEVCITFDDSLKCQFDVAYPVLKKRGLTAFWFVYTSPIIGNIEKLEIYRHFRFSKFDDIDDFYADFFITANSMDYELQCDIQHVLDHFDSDTYLKIYPFYTVNDKKYRYLRDQILGSEKFYKVMDTMLKKHAYDIRANSQLLWMSAANIQTLSAEGHVIGLHSHTHPTNMAALSYSEQKKEYSINQEIINSLTGKDAISVSYPCNSYNGDTLTIMQEIGVKVGFKTNMEETEHSPLEICREDHSNIIRKMKGKA